MSAFSRVSSILYAKNPKLGQELAEEFNEQARENTQLKAQLEMNKANLESYMELQAENKKLCDLLAERYETYLKVCADNAALQAENDKLKNILVLSKHGGPIPLFKMMNQIDDLQAENEEWRELIVRIIKAGKDNKLRRFTIIVETEAEKIISAHPKK